MELFRPPGPASAGRWGLYILLLYFMLFFLFFDTGTYRWESAQQTSADSIPTVGSPAELIHRRSTHVAPLFYRGAKCPKFWRKFRPQSSNCRMFELGRFIGKQNQTCQGTMIALPSYQTWDGWVLPTPRTVGALGTPKGKSKISYISSIPAAQAEYSATNVIPSVGAVAALKRLTCQISQFAPYSSQRGYPKG